MKLLDGPILVMAATGSRVIGGADEFSDFDYVALVESYDSALAMLVQGFKFSCSQGIYSEDQDMISVRRGNVNLLLTTSPRYFRKWVEATAIAKERKLLEKSDRVAFFQEYVDGIKAFEFNDL